MVTVIATWITTNWFLGGAFNMYGYQVLRYATYNNANMDEQMNPAEVVFPKVSKCLVANMETTLSI